MLGNASWLVVDKVGRLGIGMIVLVWMARYLGPAQFGILSYAQALVVLFTAFAAMGMTDVLIRDLVREPDRASEIVATALVLRVGGALVAIALAIGTAWWMRTDGGQTIAVVALLAISLLPQALDVIDYRFQAEMVVRPIVLLRNAAFVAFAIAKIAAILLHAPVMAFAILISAEAVAVGALLVAFARARGLRLHPSLAASAEAKRLILECWPLLVRTFAIAAYMRADQIVIGATLGAASVGVYAAAIRLPELWYFLPTAVMTATVPFLARSYATSTETFRRDITRVMRPLVWLSIVVALILSVLAVPIVGLLYGAAYAQAAPVMAIYAWAGVFGTLGLTTNAWLINAGLMRHGLYQALVGVVVNIGLNLILVPRIGIAGGAWSYLAAQFVSTFAINLFFPATRPIFQRQLRTFWLSG